MSGIARAPRAQLGTQDGFSLVAAVFLIVVLAALGAFAVRMAMSQYQESNIELLEVRAQAAADAGIGYGATAAMTGQCSTTPTTTFPPLTLTQQGLAGFVVKVTCTPTTHMMGSPSGRQTTYALIATATYGNYGQPDYVSRRAARNVTTAPP